MNKRQRLMGVWTLRCTLVVIAVVFVAWRTGRVGDSAVLPGQRVEGLTAVLDPAEITIPVDIRFEDVTTHSGISFRHFPVTRASLLPEDMGSGVACGDYDNDGLPDLFFVNFADSIKSPINGTSRAGGEAAFNPLRGRCRLYRNLGNMRFEDVSDSTGLGLHIYGMGARWGDYDNDGDLDIYVTAFGENRLFQNNGSGSFVDVTAQAGVRDARFSAGCAWADYDRDGNLDLYVSNYVDFLFRASDEGVTSRQYGSEQPYTLNPSAYAPVANSLFRNRGDGTFEEVAERAGVANATGRSLSASWTDMNNDGWTDLYVANDVSNNGVYLNQQDGTFKDIGPSSLAADYRGAMGIAVADFDNDFDQDLLITHWIAQENALFRNMFIDPMFDASSATRLWFLDSADVVGLGQVSLDTVGWATGFADFDNDGRRDLWIANGDTFEQVKNHRMLRPQKPFIFWNRGEDRFVDVASSTCKTLAQPLLLRGGCAADLDRDGRLDLVFVRHGGEAIVLRNVSETTNHWLMVKLSQSGGNADATGAKIFVTTGDVTQMSEIGTGGSYLSQDDTAVHFGLGDHAQVDQVRIVWPDGVEEIRKNVSANTILNISHVAQYPL